MNDVSMFGEGQKILGCNEERYRSTYSSRSPFLMILPGLAITPFKVTTPDSRAYLFFFENNQISERKEKKETYIILQRSIPKLCRNYF